MYIKKFDNFEDILSESLKDKMRGKSEEEIKKYVEKPFEEAYKHGYTDFDISNIGEFWFELIDKYYLYDGFYLYKDKIFSIIDNINYVEIEDIFKTKEEYKKELKNKINIL